MKNKKCNLDWKLNIISSFDKNELFFCNTINYPRQANLISHEVMSFIATLIT